MSLPQYMVIAKAIERGYRTTQSIGNHLGMPKDQVLSGLSTLRFKRWIKSAGIKGPVPSSFELIVDLATAAPETRIGFTMDALLEAMPFPIPPQLPPMIVHRLDVGGGD